VQAPPLTASPTAAGMAPKPPPGLSGQNTAVQSQPKPKTYNMGPATNLASGAPPSVPTPPAHTAGLAPNAGTGAVLPGGVTTM